MGQRQHRVLGGGVGRAGHFRDMTAGPGCDVDDAAVLLFSHRGQHRAHAIQHTVEIDIDDLLPAVQVEVGPASLGHVDAGAVDQKVDPAVLCHYLTGRLVDVGLVADVERDRLGLAALFGNAGHHPVQFRLTAPGDHDDP